MIDIENVKARLAGHSLVRAVDLVPKGHVRIETAFLYPERSSVDLFLVEDALLLPGGKLSDLGNTSQWLLDVQVRPWLSKKRQAYIEDALRIYGVAQNGGALELQLQSLDAIIDGVVRLGQACIRVADLVYTRRSALQSAVTEEVEEVLADFEMDYDVNPELRGRYGVPVRVDFLVRGTKGRSALLTLSSPNTSQAHVQANEIFRRWYDLDVPARTEQRVTIFNDSYDVYRDDDFRRLSDMSELVALSDRTTIRDLVAT